MSVRSYKIVKDKRRYAILFLQDKKNAGLITYINMKLRQVIYPFNGIPIKESMQHLSDYISYMKKSRETAKSSFKKLENQGLLAFLMRLPGL